MRHEVWFRREQAAKAAAAAMAAAAAAATFRKISAQSAANSPDIHSGREKAAIAIQRVRRGAQARSARRHLKVSVSAAVLPAHRELAGRTCPPPPLQLLLPRARVRAPFARPSLSCRCLPLPPFPLRPLHSVLSSLSLGPNSALSITLLCRLRCSQPWIGCKKRSG